jgi:hypothetical protein
MINGAGDLLLDDLPKDAVWWTRDAVTCGGVTSAQSFLALQLRFR